MRRGGIDDDWLMGARLGGILDGPDMFVDCGQAGRVGEVGKNAPWVECESVCEYIQLSSSFPCFSKPRQALSALSVSSYSSR